MDMLIDSFIQREIDSLDMDSNIAAVELALRETRHTFVPVNDRDNKCFGVISSMDLIDFRASGANPHTVKAWEICSHKIVKVESTISVREAAQLMLDHEIHHLLVCDDGELAGIISTLDVIKTLMLKR